MRRRLVLTLVLLAACSKPPAPKGGAPGSATEPPAAAPPADPRVARQAQDRAVDAWGPPDDLASHLTFLRTLAPDIDAACRNPDIIGATVAAQVEAFTPGDAQARTLGCHGARCRVRITTAGPRRVVGLEIRRCGRCAMANSRA